MEAPRAGLPASVATSRQGSYQGFQKIYNGPNQACGLLAIGSGTEKNVPGGAYPANSSGNGGGKSEAAPQRIDPLISLFYETVTEHAGGDNGIVMGPDAAVMIVLGLCEAFRRQGPDSPT
jgi:hypothetical protein